MTKSSLLGLGVEEEITKSLAEMVGCGVEIWPISYLGMPLGGNPCSRIFWEPVICKVAKRLEGWKKAFQSKGGRLTLIEQESIWAKVIKSKFGVHRNRWDAGVASRCTYQSPWKYISSLYEFRQWVGLKVGNESRIRF